MVLINLENIHEQIINFINNNNDIEIKNYDSMTEVYLKMIEKDYHFAMDRDLIKEVMIDLAYKFCPNDEFNKNLVLLTLQVIDNSDDEEDDGDE